MEQADAFHSDFSRLKSFSDFTLFAKINKEIKVKIKKITTYTSYFH